MALDPAPTTFERLRVLAAIAATGTIAGAARLLDYTPSAVSQHLSALEREAGTALAERSNRGVVLTAAGQRLAATGIDLLDEVRNAFDDVATARTTASLRVAAFPTAISALLLPVREQLEPEVRLTIVHAEPGDALGLLVGREVDAAITDGLIDVEHDLHRTLIAVEPIRLLTRSTRRVRRLDDCADAPWVLGGASSRTGQAARQRCQAAGFEPDVVAETEDHHVTFDLIRAANAVSVLPALALTDLPKGIRAVDALDLNLHRRIEFVTRRRLATNPAIGRLIRSVEEAGRVS
ncbi:MAG: LysR family transcriptional regulator [Ilumatobacter sp.]|nr:LysR family transcriptional regulator [Ilumatobacter sp.]